MNQKRHFSSIVSIFAVLMSTTVTVAADKDRKPLWDNSSPPTFHTNQDGPWGSQAPTTPIDLLAESKQPTHTEKPTLIDLVAHVGFFIPLEQRPMAWTARVTAVADMGMTTSPPSTSGGMSPVPAPGALLLLGLAGLSANRRRRPNTVG